MEKIFKNVILLYIIHNDSILMRKFIHQDYDVIDVFGFKEGDDVATDIENKLTSLFGRSFPYSFYGNIESIINKKGVTAHLSVKTYKILLDKHYNILDSYTDDVISSGKDIFWLNRDEIKNEKRLREGSKKILERIFDNRNIDIKIVENQGEKWIDAKTILFENR